MSGPETKFDMTTGRRLGIPAARGQVQRESVAWSPGCVPQLDAVRLRLWSRPPDDEVARIGRTFEQDAGCKIVVEVDD